MILETIILPFFLALGATMILVPLCIPLIKKYGLIDDPKVHVHPGIIHSKPVPRGGRIPLFF